MKKLLYSLIITAITGLTANAQTEKGYIMVGSQISNIHADKNEFSASINPNIAWFISNNFALGGGIELGYEKHKGEKSTLTYALAPMARYYFSGNEKNKFFGQVKVDFGGASMDGNSTTSYGAGAGVGYNHFLNKSVALELAAGYDYSKLKGTDGLSSFDLNFGLQIFLPTKKVKK